MSHFSANDPARWDHAIDMMQRAGDFAHTALLEAVRARSIDMAFASNRSAALPWGRIRKSPRPVLILIGDDDDTPTGPDGWLFARKFTSWARGAIVHGAGAKREHYELAVQGAVACRQFLVIDTASRHVTAWLGLLANVQTLVIYPADGVHPTTDVWETVH